LTEQVGTGWAGPVSAVADGELFVRTVVTILVIMDPLGNVPIFLALTAGADRAARSRAALQAATLAGAVVISFAVFGQAVLRVLGITLPSLQIAGGLLLGLVALELLQPLHEPGGDNAQAAPGGSGSPGSRRRHNPALVPLGTPLLAGPGAIATTMVYVQQAGDVRGAVVVVAALVTALLCIYAVLRFAAVLADVVSEDALQVVTRIMGLLATAIAVQLVALGVAEWVRSPPVP
jgi:multiple antibiotic resistance protein